MYRVAVIQNEVEMQHSGYVDSVPRYRERFDFNFDVAFNRFTGVNINTLFREGEDFLLDYDCLIIGTNATSDSDVYKILQNPESKSLLRKFIHQGKGLLICSQKKIKLETSSEIDEEEYIQSNKVRKTNFLPNDYEYNVLCRPKNENSTDGNVQIVENDSNLIQKFIINGPHHISNDMIKEHCEKNDFQKHYYRDYINPIEKSAYFPLLIDNRSPIRNTLMVASPKKMKRL